MSGASVPHPSRPVELSAGATRPAPLVVKIGGALLENAADNRAAFEGLVALHRAQPGGILLVHGGGAQVDRQLKRVGIETPRIDGIRVTSREAIEQVVGVLAGSAHMQLVGILASLGARPVGLSLSDGGLCACRRTTKYAFDPGEVGEVVGGDATVARTLLAAGFMPVVNSIGLSAEGDPLNVNADEAACAIARIAGATGLLLLSDVPGVLDASKALIPELDAARIEALVADGTISGGMIPKVRSALEASAAAGCPVTIASWRDPARANSSGGGTRIQPPSTTPCAR